MPSLLDWTDVSDADWARCLDRTHHHRQTKAWTDVARHKTLGMLFFNSSLRTRTTMELAAVQLGAHPTTLNVGSGVWGFAWEDGVPMLGGEAEHIQEAVGVLARLYDALGVRVFATLNDEAKDDADALLHRFARAALDARGAPVPVVNLESARVPGDHGVAHALDRDRVAEAHVVQHASHQAGQVVVAYGHWLPSCFCTSW